MAYKYKYIVITEKPTNVGEVMVQYDVSHLNKRGIEAKFKELEQTYPTDKYTGHLQEQNNEMRTFMKAHKAPISFTQKGIIITSPKQPNGLWGMPLNCWKIDSMPRLSEHEEVKRSALIMGIAETYPKEKFEIFFSSETGFFVKLSESGIKKVTFDDYELTDNTLTWLVK